MTLRKPIVSISGTYTELPVTDSLSATSVNVNSTTAISPIQVNATPTGFNLGTPAAPTGTPSITGGNIAAGTYYYTIVAKNPYTDLYSTPGTESAAITIASGTTGSVVLSWANLSGTSVYGIFRTTISGTYGASNYIGTTTGLTFTDTLVAPSSTQWFPTMSNLGLGQPNNPTGVILSDSYTRLSGNGDNSLTLTASNDNTAASTLDSSTLNVSLVTPVTNTQSTSGTKAAASFTVVDAGSGNSGTRYGLRTTMSNYNTSTSPGNMVGAQLTCGYYGNNTISAIRGLRQSVFIGLDNNSTPNSSATNAYAGVYALTLASSGTISNAYGSQCNISTSSGTSGNITNAYSYYTSLSHSSTGTITSAYGNYTNLNNAGNITNYYGVYFNEQAKGTISGNYYFLYQTGSAANKLSGDVQLSKTVTPAGTTGAQTINATTGSVNFAAAATSLVVTNNLVTANSIINATVAANDTTMKSVAVVAAAGSFTIYANAAATAETRVNFIVTN